MSLDSTVIFDGVARDSGTIDGMTWHVPSARSRAATT